MNVFAQILAGVLLGVAAVWILTLLQQGVHASGNRRKPTEEPQDLENDMTSTTKGTAP